MLYIFGKIIFDKVTPVAALFCFSSSFRQSSPLTSLKCFAFVLAFVLVFGFVFVFVSVFVIVFAFPPFLCLSSSLHCHHHHRKNDHAGTHLRRGPWGSVRLHSSLTPLPRQPSSTVPSQSEKRKRCTFDLLTWIRIGHSLTLYHQPSKQRSSNLSENK